MLSALQRLVTVRERIIVLIIGYKYGEKRRVHKKTKIERLSESKCYRNRKRQTIMNEDKQ